jgi:hypothetical protein
MDQPSGGHWSPERSSDHSTVTQWVLAQVSIRIQVPRSRASEFLRVFVWQTHSSPGSQSLSWFLCLQPQPCLVHPHYGLQSSKCKSDCGALQLQFLGDELSLIFMKKQKTNPQDPSPLMWTLPVISASESSLYSLFWPIRNGLVIPAPPCYTPLLIPPPPARLLCLFSFMAAASSVWNAHVSFLDLFKETSTSTNFLVPQAQVTSTQLITDALRSQGHSVPGMVPCIGQGLCPLHP